ncbi:extensin family protein [Sphingomonas sp. LY29]|uniref:extensin-like domain-containing protein n=1 Tax=Sphingomonas sp. LY29 TaxID=3095341 RepID=UPI003A7F2AFC
MPKPRSARIGCWLTILLLVGALFLGWREYQRVVVEEPERFPWTPLSLDDPVGPFTGRKLAALTDDGPACKALLDAAGFAEVAAPPRSAEGGQCGYDDGVRLTPETDRSIDFRPDGLVTACPVAAALAIWEHDVVQLAARRHFDSRVTRIDHAGSYSCRRLYGRSDGPFSEHATADAVDIVAFRLADGRRITLLGNWNGKVDEKAFLRDVRDGACDLFSTVLSPDYNAAHADHLHFDQASRGATGWRGCR